ncbi:MAG: phosphate ABC transporter substrate-binding protein [Candidatus Eiseniibacteriota bacterium]
MHRCLLVGVALLALLGSGCGGGSRPKNVTVKGSDTMVILGQRWADMYMKAHPGSAVAVTGGGSGTGIAALINGTIDIAQSSRAMKDEEKQQFAEKAGGPPQEIAVARDGVTVYVHSSNPLTTISMEQLKGIYTGAIKNWSDVGGPDKPIVVYSRENNSGTYVFFKEHVLGGADFSPTAATLPGTAAVVNAVTQDPGGIGYGGIAYGSGIKHLAILDAGGQPIEPKEATILDGSYPLSRPLYWYVSPKAPKEATDLVAWVQSPEGQAVIKDVGYFPAR